MISAGCPWAPRSRTRYLPRSPARFRRWSARRVSQRAFCRGYAERADFSALDILDSSWKVIEQNLHLAGDQIRQRGSSAPVRHVKHVDAGHHLEQLARHVRRSPVTGGGHSDFAWIGLGERDELGTVVAVTDGCTSITLVSSIVPATGALSRRKSYGSLS